MADQVKGQDVELEEVEEAHDPKNAEAQSVAASQAADDKAPTAKKRPGDKTGGDKAMPKVTPGTPEKATASVVTTSPNTNVKAESVELNVDFSDDLNALIEGEATLSEDFKGKAAIIFEAAIKSHLTAEVDRLEESYKQELEEEVASIKDDLVEKVDSYLNYVVEQWMEENRLAIESGLRAEIAENFMNGLKNLFTESYIDVPEGKVDLVDELAQQVEDLEEKFNKATENALAINEELIAYKREAIIREQSTGLAETQVEKLKSLTEGVDFEDETSFAKKVATIKESYFSNKTVTTEDISEGADDGEATPAQVNGIMEQYLAAIRKSSK